MSYLNGLRAWLRFFRAHTAILESPLAIIGAAISLGTLWKPIIFFWCIFGVIYHFVGYGMNSYVDWKKGFDKDDPQKQHHPLNTGEISPDDAKNAIIITLVTLILYGLIIARFSLVAIVSALIMLVSGVAYNYLGKYTRFKFIPISIVHTMVFIFPFLQYQDGVQISSGTIGLLFVLMALAYFIHHIFQIAISGDIKDIKQDEATLLKDLGLELRISIDNILILDSGLVVLFSSYVLLLAQAGIAGSALLLFEGYHSAIFLLLILSGWMVYEGDKTVASGTYDRGDRVTHMSRRELAGYMLIHSAAIPLIGYFAYILITVYMLGYLFVMNKFLWGTWVKPEV